MPGKRSVRRLAVLALQIFLVAAQAWAYGPNLLVNPSFDTDLSGWEGNIAAWMPSDASGAVTSGSATFNLIRQCVPVVGGASYALAASFWIPATTADPFAQLELGAAFYSETDCKADGFLETFRPLPALDSWKTLPRNKWNLVAGKVVAPAAASSARVGLGVYSSSKEGFHADNVFFGTGTCAPSATQLCLNHGRFKVEARWKVKPDSGYGTAVPFADESGSFWFFSPTNIELDVKVLNGCALNNRYWFFAAGLTNVNVVLTVTDTQTGVEKVYVNPQNQVFATITDIDAFATCP